jgi:hypothetical protein
MTHMMQTPHTHASYLPSHKEEDDDEEDDEDGAQLRDRVVVPLFWGTLLAGWFAWFVILCVLLAQDNTLEVNGLCGSLWPFMMVRTLLFGLEWLQSFVAFSGLENLVRQAAGLPAIDSHADGGCFALLLGSSELLRWVGTLIHFVYNGVLAIAAIAIVPESVFDRTPCCVSALAATSFTGTYTLAILGWVFLVSDCAQTAARGTWLAIRHGEARQLVLGQ